jgi:lactate permease
MTFAAASAPLLVVLLTMGVLRWSAAAAGAAGVSTALVAALLAFDFAATAPPNVSPAHAATGAFAEALHSAATILWIIFPALSIYELQRRTGAFDRIRNALIGISDNRLLQAVLIAWFFGLFMEGAAGFGTPVALAAPLLVGLGYPPATAVALALVGHAAGVSFGAIGTPIFAQAEITALSPHAIGVTTALLHAALGVILLLFVMRIASGTITPGSAAWAGIAATCFLAPYLTFAIIAGPELPTLGGALIGGGVFIAILRRRRSQLAGPPVENHFLSDLAPYLIILLLVLATRLIAPLQETLGGMRLGWSLHDTFRGTFQPFYHPGTILLLGLLLGGFVTGRANHLLPAARAAAGRLGPVAIALLTMLAMSRIMVHSGMIGTLAIEAGRTGAAWPLLAPAMGVLGTFVTGSATASNILLTELQLTTAAALSLPPLLMVAGQGFGAAIGNVIAPHNIIAGAAAVGLKGQEGDILARTAVPCIVYAGAGGASLLLLAYAFSHEGP